MSFQNWSHIYHRAMPLSIYFLLFFDCIEVCAMIIVVLEVQCTYFCEKINILCFTWLLLYFPKIAWDISKIFFSVISSFLIVFQQSPKSTSCYRMISYSCYRRSWSGWESMWPPSGGEKTWHRPRSIYRPWHRHGRCGWVHVLQVEEVANSHLQCLDLLQSMSA